MSIKCIFCLNEFEKGSEEHVFPDSLGGNFKIYNVCKGCNGKLGSNVDTYLVNNILSQFERLNKKIKGKSGFLPNPFRNGHLKGSSDYKLQYKLSKDGKPESLAVVPYVSETKDGQVFARADASNPDKVVEMINRNLKRNGNEVKTKEEILSQAKYEKIENPEMEINLAFDLDSYKKAIIKIIYEMTCYWLGEEYLKDPIGKILREYIFSEDLEVEGLKGFVDLVGTKPPTFFNRFTDDESHTAILIRDNEKLCCYVNVMDTFEGMMMVTDEANKYDIADNLRGGKFLKTVIKSKEVIEKGFLEVVSQEQKRR
ncbi:hypothetical protein COJ26_27685 [Bacillus thuringiensis]|uniref:HNH endonuclease n=1 Tax=Bacillus thuringiensis TaxID=1428 RepID=UPI000BF64C1C|nr:HNH endonuclease [Bacillus thuringiensis]PFL28081.1 hypothetical protein COJ26_27685 [Bacillus thuringiensis]